MYDRIPGLRSNSKKTKPKIEIAYVYKKDFTDLASLLGECLLRKQSCKKVFIVYENADNIIEFNSDQELEL